MKFKTGQKWLRSDGKVCIVTEIIPPLGMCDQDGVWYSEAGLRQDGNSLVTRILSDDELVKDFIDGVILHNESIIKKAELENSMVTFPIKTLLPVMKRIQAQSKLLAELKQLIADSGEKGAAMIKRIEEL